jgi:hypothetical protein
MPSGKMALLVFQGGVAQGLLGRIGRYPFEMHGFGIISEGSTGPNATHIMCCGVQGAARPPVMGLPNVDGA